MKQRTANLHPIADKLSPGELVEDLNECLIEFDSIIEKYNLEKIKTIGDSYICADNIPSPNPDHAYKIVKAAREIQAFIEKNNLLRVDKSLQPGNKNWSACWTSSWRGWKKEICLRYMGKRC